MTYWQAIWQFIVEWYWLPVLLLYAGIILTMVSENRHPAKSLAYILVLVFLPVVGLVVYYFVGRKPVFKKRLFEKKARADRWKLQHYYGQLRPRMEDQDL